MIDLPLDGLATLCAGVGIELRLSPIGDTPRLIGATPDSLTMIEIMGPAEGITGLTIVSTVSPEHEAAVRRGAVMMGGLLQLALPTWPHRDGWLAGAIRSARERAQRNLPGRWIDRSGVRVLVRYEAGTNMLTFSMTALTTEAA